MSEQPVYIDSKSPSGEAQWLLMNEKVSNTQQTAKLNDEHIREILNLKDLHQREKDDLIIEYLKQIYDAKIQMQDMKTELIRNMNDKAVDKALESMNDRQEQSNNKFALLKDQATLAELKYAHKSDLQAMEDKCAIRFDAHQKQIGGLVRVVSIGIGILLTLQFLIPIALKYIND